MEAICTLAGWQPAGWESAHTVYQKKVAVVSRIMRNARDWTQMQKLEEKMVQFNDLMDKIKGTKAYRIVRKVRVKT